MAYCTNCGKETDWTSKSGYCKKCAERILKARKADAKRAKRGLFLGKSDNQPATATAALPTPNHTPTPSESPSHIQALHAANVPSKPRKIPTCKDGQSIAYHYEQVKIYNIDNYPVTADMLQADVSFVQEPQNTYDSHAIKVVLGGKRIGYLYRGVIQDMANDFINAGLPYVACISGLNPDTNEIYLFIAFYRNKVRKTPISQKTFKLTGTGSEEHQTLIMMSTEGEEVDCSEDIDSDKYVALCGGAEIGFFPKSAQKYIDDGAAFFINSIDFDDNNDKYVVTVVAEWYA